MPPFRHPVARAGFAIRSIDAPDGPAPVHTTDRQVTPFYAVIEFDCPQRAAAGTVVVVPPLSGVLPRLIRDIILGLLPRFRVLVPEWINPRFVPRTAGSFGFQGNIAGIIAAMQAAGPGAGLVALCQSGTPALAAATVMETRGDPAAPAMLALMGAPIDPFAAPTSLSRYFVRTPMWRLAMAVTPVPFGFPGAGRSVYAAETQRTILATNRMRSLLMPMWPGLSPDMAEIEAHLPFAEHSRMMMDMEGRQFLENIDLVFRRRALLDGRLHYGGQPVTPAALRRCALLTIEGDRDGIIAPGQTVPAHALCSGLPVERRAVVLAEGCHHLSLFRGPLFQSRVLPELLARLDRWVA
ncbi:MAG: hypothetical protein Q4G22_10940 [Paracoccus sp. (in: a-proteobacteria)]|uniref:hypothetical protein n=1 Tax=Paracoccus sp. TaxID=267 RepID=UPI0026E0CC21|nr:hypothetical protein [Paracoccus sp. (in: a-proteobacteria)]MDO5632341.1 hypothetical protein [Paracoccus sp. (in: a-proteobacteria)]